MNPRLIPVLVAVGAMVPIACQTVSGSPTPTRTTTAAPVVEVSAPPASGPHKSTQPDIPLAATKGSTRAQLALVVCDVGGGDVLYFDQSEFGPDLPGNCHIAGKTQTNPSQGKATKSLTGEASQENPK